MRISPADTTALLTLIDEFQKAQAAHDERTVTNAALSKAVRDAKPGSPEAAKAREDWDTVRKSRPASEGGVLEARDKLADFCAQVELIPAKGHKAKPADTEPEIARNPIPGAKDDGAGISRTPL
mgnify:FL=1